VSTRFDEMHPAASKQTAEARAARQKVRATFAIFAPLPVPSNRTAYSSNCNAVIGISGPDE